MRLSTEEIDRLHEAMLYVAAARAERKVLPDETWRGISNHKTFDELLRRLEQLVAVDGRGIRPGWDQNWLQIGQAAEMYFSGTDLQQVTFTPDTYVEDDPSEVSSYKVNVRVRHFGLFAPFGPMPIHITEHAKHERTLERNAAFEAFLNLLSGHLAILNYRAFANTHPLLSMFAHPRLEGFSERLGRLASGWMAGNDKEFSRHVSRCRKSAAWAYVRPERSLSVLESILSSYFSIQVKVSPRYGRWIEVGYGNPGEKHLGQWRIGRRVFDTQSAILVEIGPLDAVDFPKFQRASERMKTMVRVIDDYTGGQASARIDVQVRTASSLRASLGKTRIGQDAWIKPSAGIKTVCAYDPVVLF
ncbi:MAG: tssG [Proteobacteria bacterium]|nr:tssG [Pseudomonadota bacterium]